MTNAGIKAVLKNAMRGNEKIPTVWMGFYLNVFLYLALVLNVLNIPSSLSGLFSIPIWIGKQNVLEIALFFANAAAAVSSMMAFVELRDFTQSGYTWNIVLLCSGYASIFLMVLPQWLQGEAHTRMSLAFLIGSQVAIALIWLIPNLIYFKKRKHLFRRYTTAEVSAALKGEPPIPARPIRKPCHYQPSKARVNVRNQASGKATRYARILKAYNER